MGTFTLLRYLWKTDNLKNLNVDINLEKCRFIMNNWLQRDKYINKLLAKKLTFMQSNLVDKFRWERAKCTRCTFSAL